MLISSNTWIVESKKMFTYSCDYILWTDVIRKCVDNASFSDRVLLELFYSTWILIIWQAAYTAISLVIAPNNEFVVVVVVVVVVGGGGGGGGGGGLVLRRPFVRPSFRPSVRPSRIPCPLCSA